MMRMFFTMQEVLHPSQLKRLGDHKYSCTSGSVLDPVMQPFWNWLVTKVPMYLAPNLITTAGLVVNIVTTLILVFYSPDGIQEVPRWACVLCALGLFIYQSLDAIDGKQAGRTNSNSPLGELFDHGCDSISTVFVALGVCLAVQLGSYPSWMFFNCFNASMLFYCAHWQAYVSGTLRFGKFDVTEAQFIVMLLHLLTAAFGPSFWAIQIPLINWELRILFTVAATLGTWQQFCSHFKVILSGGVGRNGSSVAGTSVLSPCIPFSVVVVPAFIIFQKSTTGVFHEHLSLYIMAFGLVAAKVTNKLVVAHMTKSEMDYLDSVLLGPGMLFLNQYFNTFINEYVVLWLCMIWATFDLMRYCTVVCNQICNHLHISLFKISPRPSAPVLPSLSTSAPSSRNGITTRSSSRR